MVTKPKYEDRLQMVEHNIIRKLHTTTMMERSLAHNEVRIFSRAISCEYV